MEELRPCPFCGMLPQITNDECLSKRADGLYEEKTWFYAECVCCKLTKAFSTEDEVIAAWNHRAAPAIIYCKDCKWLMRPDPDNSPAEFEPYCDHPCGLPGESESLEQFCSYGERLDGESDCCH